MFKRSMIFTIIYALVLMSGIEAVTCTGYSDFGGSYLWFEVPEVNAVIRGAGGDVTIASPKGGICTNELGWGALVALGFRCGNCWMGEFRGFYSQNNENSKNSTSLSSNSLVFYEITGSGMSRSASADHGVSSLDLRLYGGDALFIYDLFCSDCNLLRLGTGLSYKRLEQEHHFYGILQGSKVSNFFVKDDVYTDYIGWALEIKGETYFSSCMAFFFSGVLDFYYASDCLTAAQTVNASIDYTLDEDHDEFALYGEGKMGLMFINGCFTLRVNGLYGVFSYAPKVVHPLSGDVEATHLDCDLLSRYGVEMSVGLRF